MAKHHPITSQDEPHQLSYLTFTAAEWRAFQLCAADDVIYLAQPSITEALAEAS